MAENSAIEWTDTTWNPVNEAPRSAQAVTIVMLPRFSERFRGVPGHPVETGFDLTLRPARLLQPLEWKRPRMIFERMNKFWGDNSWRQAAYGKDPQGNFFGSEPVKLSNKAVVDAFRKRRTLAPALLAVPLMNR